jgi:hypothetical protein
VTPHKIADTTMELLRLAVQKDNFFQRSIVRNYAVIACLNFAQRLQEISILNKPDRDIQLMSLLKCEDAPINFIILTGASLRRITNRINEMIRQKNTTDIPLVTDFDAHALKALGLTLSEVIWLPVQKDDFSGPSLENCFDRLREKSLEELWRLFTKHYMGNILQHYFDQAGLRKDPELRYAIPADEEYQLRERDASAIAELSIEQLRNKKKEEPNLFDYIDIVAGTLQHLIKLS